MKKRIRICSVQAGSPAMDAGIEAGDVLLSINGEKPQDIFDYRFLTTESTLLIEIEKKNGEIWEIELEKDEYEDLGLEFEDPLISGAKRCNNKCIFCFIDQLPKNMRETVYFKDDDTRLSFLTGNYVTLTNIKRNELDRIVKYRMSPVNVSVHTTNPELRVKMLRNRFAGDILEKIKVLTDGGITVNAQIVLCRGLNDGAELDRTLDDLSGLYPGLASISVVPVGLTKWREGLYRLIPFDAVSSAAVIDQVKGWQDRFLSSFGTRLVYLADEFYISSGTQLPGYDEYEGFPQIENGVGLMPLLIHEFHEYLSSHHEDMSRQLSEKKESRMVSIATGICAYGHIKELSHELEKRYNKLKVSVYPIKNEFFGENVTVTGLLTGGDIIRQLKDKELGSELLISRSMLKAGEELFLDDYTVESLESEIGTKVTIVENNGEDFIKKILGIQNGVN